MPSDPSPATIEWRSDTVVGVDGTEYDLWERDDGPTDRLRLYKSRQMVESYGPIIAEFPRANVVEMGIFGGGSTAFFAQVLAPRKLIAIDIRPDPVEELESFLVRRSLTDRVRPHYGVDQSDRARLTEIIEAEFGEAPLDLVLDDASHLYHPTKRSFEILFPRLRPGGLYVIEDWRSEQDWFNFFLRAMDQRGTANADAVDAGLAGAFTGPMTAERGYFERLWVNTMRDPDNPDHSVLSTWYDALGTGPSTPTRDALLSVLDGLLADDRVPTDPWADPDPPLLALAAELLVGIGGGDAAMVDLVASPHWLAVRRGPAELDPATFTLDDVARDRLGVLARTASRMTRS
jgi:Methyltransferase domain